MNQRYGRRDGFSKLSLTVSANTNKSLMVML